MKSRSELRDYTISLWWEFAICCPSTELVTFPCLQVEQSQTQWLTTNQDLSYELEKALYQNKQMKSEIARLKEQLELVQILNAPQS